MKITKLTFFAILLLLSATTVHSQEFFFSSVVPGNCAANDGIVTIVPIRGVPPFTYAWSTGATGISLVNAPKGTYSATLTDATGATVVHTHILNSKALDLRLSSVLPSGPCNPLSGALTVEPLGGQPPFAYLWSNAQTTATATGLGTGNYLVTVTDAAGCSALGEYSVGPVGWGYYPQAQINIVQQPDCSNPNTGALSATMLFSGFPPYTFSWSTGATTESISALAKGDYTVTVSDALGCDRINTISLGNKLNLNGSVVCSGSNTGTITAALVNGVAPISYTWSNGQNGANLINLSNGSYDVTATDAAGCSATGRTDVVIPVVQTSDASSSCFSGNNGIAYAWLSADTPLSYLWDNGVTTSYNNTLSQGLHQVTVTTGLGCTVIGTVDIEAPEFPALQISTNTTAADCVNGISGSLDVDLSGGDGLYSVYIYGPDGFVSTELSPLLNIKGGTYSIYARSGFLGDCYTSIEVTVPDLSGFTPETVIGQIDCSTGYGSAAIINVNTPNVQYNWSNGSTSSAIFNLTEGNYAVTVSAGSGCIYYDQIWLYKEDSLHQNLDCSSLVTGMLYNDLGVPGCSGSVGIPFEVIETQPSGAINFTDASGFYSIKLPAGTHDLAAANYAPGEIACPTGGVHTVVSTVGTTIANQDFHLLNNNPVDHRISQKALRTAQPGYPFSLRVEVCNDGNSGANGTLDLAYGNFLGNIAPVQFSQHSGFFALNNETAGTPNNSANFGFNPIAPGACELLQADFTVPTTTPVTTEFTTEATVSPSSGDPTPTNNKSSLYNTVIGSYDPNSVLAFPARSGNPHDGGKIIRGLDNSITYQITFQNTGNAPANLVVVRDTLDSALQLATIRNISASHNMKVQVEGDNKVLVFSFPNINLPDSSSNYANSIGNIQFDIDLKPNPPLGSTIEKQAAIFFDFNPPVITNKNTLELVAAVPAVIPSTKDKNVVLIPNPADTYFGLYADAAATLSVYDMTGKMVMEKSVEAGLQQFETSHLPNGIYAIKLDFGGRIQHGKLVISH